MGEAPEDRDSYRDYEEEDCWNCGGEGYVYGCSWDWQCDTYDEGEGTCLCTRRCDFCNPPKTNPELQQVLADALASANPSHKDQAEAIAAWNDRPTLAAAGEKIEYVGDAVEAVQRLLERGKATVDADGYLVAIAETQPPTDFTQPALSKADVSQGEVEAVARALYACEKARSDHTDGIIAKARESAVVHYTMEPWEECAETFRSDARAAIRSLKDSGR